MKESKKFAGIDVSKRTFDVVLLFGNDPGSVHQSFEQSPQGYKQFSEWLKKLGADCVNTLCCMEHTGLYSDGLISYLLKIGCPLWVEMAIKIKRSMGLQRGGDDKASAKVIAEYALRFNDRARLWKPVDTKLLEIRALLKQRERMLLSLKQLQVPVNEYKECGQLTLARQLSKNQQTVTRHLQEAVINIESQIASLVASDEELSLAVKRITSIKGVGLQTATSLLVYTKGFTMFENGKQLACYCGVVPFSKSSGTSVRTKPGVSPFANRRLKSLLHLCAMAALRHDAEIKAYYKRKVEEGKNKMLVINAIRNKLLQRIYALLRDKRSYEENYVYNRGKLV
jgi:transposase